MVSKASKDLLRPVFADLHGLVLFASGHLYITLVLNNKCTEIITFPVI